MLFIGGSGKAVIFMLDKYGKVQGEIWEMALIRESLLFLFLLTVITSQLSNVVNSIPRVRDVQWG